MRSLTVNVHEAKTHLSRLLEQAHGGQEIILAKAGKSYARLMPLATFLRNGGLAVWQAVWAMAFRGAAGRRIGGLGVATVRLLLDTHALLWWWTDDARLSAAARSAIADEGNQVYVSAASAWEVATKHRLGTLTEVPQAAPRFAELVAADGFSPLPIAQHHALRAGAHPHERRDPFDRMLAAQAQTEGMSLVSCDAALPAFGCTTFW